ncbi:LOW QUALITY PROTEIN: TMEM254 isoform 4 [Pan troglodytes]|uniref:Transmembrane protein 254 n=3 Tax=Homininae TaxID=207598 RepID=A0A087WZM8_HUMAN|nr:transmembrane protein 254 isoform 5 [Homo sapiens]KAI4076614.1 transmembrane protein 254 [Homo sapiens]PNI88530.1 LOW QUALITY PROTEIN: TMEM254 isoform 4 [Pan troglodytes]|eukprot:NP_001257300.1 transmembrane protein 254 isoform 5 [Homo sapiens]
MATAAGATYFQRGSLFWFTVITLSFGYYTPQQRSETLSKKKERKKIEAKNGDPNDCSEFLRGLSSGLRVSLIRTLGPWAPSLSTWWTTITPSCAMGIGLPG